MRYMAQGAGRAEIQPFDKPRTGWQLAANRLEAKIKDRGQMVKTTEYRTAE
jgi:hypothetical protein